jgi:aminoglycoside 2'-N-acetyltransferase I
VFKTTTVFSNGMSETERRDVIELCGGVFNVDYGYLLDLCPIRTHVLAYAGDRLVSHALWLDRRIRVGDGPWFTVAYIEGVATHPDHRRRGYGEAVMRRLQEGIADYPLGVLSPAVEPWYQKLGWERWQGRLWIDKHGEMEETLGETVLIYRMPRTESLDLTLPLAAEWRPFELW